MASGFGIICGRKTSTAELSEFNTDDNDYGYGPDVH